MLSYLVEGGKRACDLQDTSILCIVCSYYMSLCFLGLIGHNFRDIELKFCICS